LKKYTEHEASIISVSNPIRSPLRREFSSRKCRPQLKMLGHGLRLPPQRLPPISHTEALDILRSQGLRMNPADELPVGGKTSSIKALRNSFLVNGIPCRVSRLLLPSGLITPSLPSFNGPASARWLWKTCQRRRAGIHRSRSPSADAANWRGSSPVWLIPGDAPGGHSSISRVWIRCRATHPLHL